jgi:alpha-glucosidase (family GH31 glycosyl hydrolase)
MNMNMFGIPHVGADVCGFFGPTRDDNMCSRWIQLATFYPFARVHQNLTYLGKDSDRSEPYLMSEPYKTNAIASIRYRYSFLRMMYTCLFEINQRGGTCFDPLFYHYPNDENVYQNYEQQFIVANSVLVSPVLEYLEDGVTTYKGYMPQGKWVNLANYSEILDAKAGGKVFDLTDKPVVNAYLKQGSLIPF